ncbi:hypothetical protein FB451DRAFT_1368108 [Mycena latifolia]|nr:hypothetical protein FB451DRAFT_1368108 [Mycena latifolia]
MSSRVPHQLYSLFAQTALALGISLLDNKKEFTALRTGVRTKRDLQRQICRRALSLRRFQAYLMAQRLSHRGRQRDLKSDSPTQCAIRTNVLGRIPLAGDKSVVNGRETGGGESCSLQIIRKREPLAEEDVVARFRRRRRSESDAEAGNVVRSLGLRKLVRAFQRPGGTKGGFVSWIRLAECGGRNSERPTPGLRLPRSHYSLRTCGGVVVRVRGRGKTKGAALKHHDYPVPMAQERFPDILPTARWHSRAGPRCSLLR